MNQKHCGGSKNKIKMPARKQYHKVSRKNKKSNII
jgi:hypothetical protein